MDPVELPDVYALLRFLAYHPELLEQAPDEPTGLDYRQRAESDQWCLRCGQPARNAFLFRGLDLPHDVRLRWLDTCMRCAHDVREVAAREARSTSWWPLS